MPSDPWPMIAGMGAGIAAAAAVGQMIVAAVTLGQMSDNDKEIETTKQDLQRMKTELEKHGMKVGARSTTVEACAARKQVEGVGGVNELKTLSKALGGKVRSLVAEGVV
ncbi:MAG: hypothetical protein Q9170_006634 [Blastenia crenularia]